MPLEEMLDSQQKKLLKSYLKEMSVDLTDLPRTSRGRRANKRRNISKQHRKKSQLLLYSESSKTHRVNRPDKSEFYRNILSTRAETDRKPAVLHKPRQLRKNIVAFPFDDDSSSLSSTSKWAIERDFSNLSLGHYSSPQISEDNDQNNSKYITLPRSSSLSSFEGSKSMSTSNDDHSERRPTVEKQYHSETRGTNMTMHQQHSKPEISAGRTDVVERVPIAVQSYRRNRNLNSSKALYNAVSSKCNFKKESSSSKFNCQSNSNIIPSFNDKQSVTRRLTGTGLNWKLKHYTLRDTSKISSDFTGVISEGFASSESHCSEPPKLSKSYINQGTEKLNIKDFINHDDTGNDIRVYSRRNLSDASSSSVSEVQDRSRTSQKANRFLTNRKPFLIPREKQPFGERIQGTISLHLDTDLKSTRQQVEERLKRYMTSSESDDSDRLPPIRSEHSREFQTPTYEKLRLEEKFAKLLTLRETEMPKRFCNKRVLPKISSVVRNAEEDELFRENMRKLTVDGVSEAKLNVLRRYKERMRDLENNFIY